ncbi:MAG: hypothetical protein WCL00_01715 [Bacteroidota bacterium]
MEELDYYTVMESKIRYYANKYDPQNKLGSVGVNHMDNGKISLDPVKPLLVLIEPEPSERIPPLKAKILAGFDHLIALLF